MLTEAGFARIRNVPLAADPRVKGPGLFVATAEKLTPAHDGHAAVNGA
jgi:hypothetical protein